MTAKTESSMTFRLDFIGLDSEHCGTTFAAKLLASHPDISFAHQDENLYSPDSFHLGGEWYRYQFVGPGSIAGERSLGYSGIFGL